MPVIAAHLLEPDQGNMQVYNGLDAALTFEINEALAELRRNDETTYRFELSMQAPALEMMLRGMRVDPVAREKAIRETRAKLDCTNGIIARLAEAIQGSYKPTLANSGTQLRELFYHSMGYRELRVSVKGESKVPMDRKVLERLEAMHYHARPIINAILLARDLSKQLQVMETEIDPDWRFRCSYNIGGTSTGRWCLSGETEVLTKQGWTKIKDVEETQTIAVWNQHKDIQWQESKKLVFDNSKPLIKIQNDRFSLEVTDDHRLPYFTSKRNLNVAIAKDRKQLHTAPLSGNLSANFLDKKLTNVIVMTQADGTIVHSNLIRFHFRKERKIERCKKNLEECGIPFKYTLSEADGTSYIYVYDPPEWMKQAKLLDSWLLDHDPFHFINEVRQWDGYIDPRNGGCEYSTTIKQNAEWVQTMAHLMGCCATVKARPERGNWNISYRVWIGTTDNTRIHKHQYEDKDTIDDKVYCMETSTGFFLVRHNGLICVTGNSSSKSGTGTGGNFQNVSEELRRIFIPDIGYKLYGIDLEQAEAREVAWFCFTILGDASYLDACESGDLHTAVARLVWPNFAWTGDLKADRKIADQRFYRHYTYRDMCKKLAHGCLTEDHEVLTPGGWVPITDKPSVIMQFSKDHSEFVKVSEWTDKQWEGIFHTWEGQSLSIKMTDPHRVYYTTMEAEDITCKAARDVPKSAKIPNGWGYIGGNADISPPIARLIAAYQCDGHYGGIGKKIRFHLRKDRKVMRLETLAIDAGIPFQKLQWESYSIESPDISNWPKEAGAYLLSWPKESLMAYLEELPHWDGHFSKTAISLSSKNINHLDWIRTCNRLMGIGGNINGPFVSGFGTNIYHLQFNNRKYASTSSVIRSTEYESHRVLCPTVSSGAFYIRRKSKISVTGNSNYYGKPPALHAQTKVPLKLVREFQERYFEAFPCIQRMHQWVAQELQRTGFLTNSFGRRRDFFDRADSEETLRGAIAFLFQSATGDRLNLGLYRIWRHMPGRVQILSQLHDAVYFQAREEDEAEVIPEALERIQVWLQHGERKFTIRGEAKGGYNWANRFKLDEEGNAIEWNKRGLDKIRL